MQIDIQPAIDTAMRATGNYGKNHLMEAIGDTVCAGLGLWSRMDIHDTVTYSIEHDLLRTIKNDIRNRWPFSSALPKELQVAYSEGSDSALSQTTKITRLTIPRPSLSIDLPRGRILRDDIRQQFGIILSAVPTEAEEVYEVKVAQPSRARSAKLVVRTALYCGRFLFATTAGSPHDIQKEALKRNFTLVATRYDELEKKGLLP